MSLQSLVLFLVVGLVAVWLASMVMRGKRRGIGGYLLIGIIGALFGAWLFGVLGIYAGGLIGQLIIAFLGAVILIAIIRALKGI